MSRDEVTSLLRAAAVNWVHAYARSMGAALAFLHDVLDRPPFTYVSSIPTNSARGRKNQPTERGL